MKIKTISKRCIELVAQFEGLRLKPYLCPAGVPTIGYGTTFYPNGKRVTMEDPPITEEQANNFLVPTLQNFAKYVDSFCRDDINQNQFDALTSFCYNVGPTNMKKSTLLRKVNKDPNDPSIADEFRKWGKSKGKVLKGLTRRREAELKLYFEPIKNA